MNKIIFDDYINPSRKVIPFLYFLYVMAIPLAIFLIKLNLKPNSITTLSNISAAVSYYFILAQDSFLFFSFFWILALFLDMCDGMVSRRTNQMTPQGSFYDHFTDQIKIILLFLSVGLYYNSTLAWALAFLCSTVFLLRALLLYMLKYRSKLLESADQNNAKIKLKLSNRFLLVIKKYFYNNVFLIMGQFNVYLVFIFIKNIHVHVLLLILFIILFNFINELKKMNYVNSKLQDNNLKWS